MISFIRGKVCKVFSVAACCVVLVACSPKISQENFDKIHPNMTMAEVVAILGKPVSSEDASISGISGTSAVWKDETAEINIQFLNDKMVVKSFSKEGKENSNNAAKS